MPHPPPKFRRRPRPAAALGAGVVAVLVAVGCGGGHRAKRPSAGAPGGSAAAPRCAPAQLNRSAVLPGTSLAVSPLPGSLDANPATQVSLLGAPAAELAHVTATGSLSGAHTGDLRAYSQGDGASFVPRSPFTAGETVTVSGQLRGAPFSYQFTVSHPDVIPHSPPGQPVKGGPSVVNSFHSRPDLRPPRLTVTVRGANLAPGYVFASPYAGPGQAGPTMYDNQGNVVWFHPVPPGNQTTDFQVQTYEGRHVLTWWQGYIPPEGFGEGEDVLADHSYRTVAVVRASNGLTSDLHDFQLAPHARALTTAFNPVRCDLRSAGGPADQAVTDGVYQEIDVKTGLVRRQWDSLDHVSLRSSYPNPKGASLLYPYDYFHINSLDVGSHGDVLISARSTWTVYDVNATSGQVLTHIGGKNSDLKLGPGTAVAYQHDARLLPNGTISIFDNGATPTVHAQSRGITVRVDPRTQSARLVRQLTHPRPLVAGTQGNFQTLPNGDAFLGWGAEPYFSEYNAAGQLIFDAHLPQPDASYRGFRFPWNGRPLTRPAIAAARAATGAATIYASWNGATGVSRWRVLAGRSTRDLRPVAAVARTGFETPIAVAAPQATVFEVQALGAQGRVMGTSRPSHLARATVTRTATRRRSPTPRRAVRRGRPASGSLVADRPQTADTNRR